MKLALLLFALAVPAAAQQADGGAPDDLEEELEKAIQADKKSAEHKGGGQKGPPAADAATSASAGSAPQTPSRRSQSLNADISAVLDAGFVSRPRAAQLPSGDEPGMEA